MNGNETTPSVRVLLFFFVLLLLYSIFLHNDKNDKNNNNKMKTFVCTIFSRSISRDVIIKKQKDDVGFYIFLYKRSVWYHSFYLQKGCHGFPKEERKEEDNNNTKRKEKSTLPLLFFHVRSLYESTFNPWSTIGQFLPTIIFDTFTPNSHFTFGMETCNTCPSCFW